MTDLSTIRTADGLRTAWGNAQVDSKSVLTLDDFQLCVLYNILSTDDRVILFTLKYINNINYTGSYFS